MFGENVYSFQFIHIENCKIFELRRCKSPSKIKDDCIVGIEINKYGLMLQMEQFFIFLTK
jgi:hypothetical protein